VDKNPFEYPISIASELKTLYFLLCASTDKLNNKLKLAIINDNFLIINNN
jgi:hypothetical protein